MNPTQFQQITGRYSRMSIAVLGDFCLDRYLEIDPGLAETSLETGLSVYNVVRVRRNPAGRVPCSTISWRWALVGLFP